MKKLFSLLLGLLVGGVAFAQVSGGVKAGANFANLEFSSGGYSVSPDSRTSLHLGAWLAANISGNLAIQPELLYSSQGASFSSDELYKLSYINIPVLLRYNFAEIANLHAGPQFGLLLSAEAEDDGDTQDIKDDLKGSDVGLAIGGGVDLPMGLGFGLRYVIGLSDISDFDSGDIKSKVFQIYASFRLFGGN